MACLLANDVIDCAAILFPSMMPLTVFPPTSAFSISLCPFPSLACLKRPLQAAIREGSLAPAQDADRTYAKLERLPILPGALVPDRMARVLPIVTRDQLKMLCYHTLGISFSISMLAEASSCRSFSYSLTLVRSYPNLH